MGTGEGTHEIPKHLLEELRKRPIYYKSEAPKQLQVSMRDSYNDSVSNVGIKKRHVNTLYAMVDCVLVKTL